MSTLADLDNALAAFTATQVLYASIGANSAETRTVYDVLNMKALDGQEVKAPTTAIKWKVSGTDAALCATQLGADAQTTIDVILDLPHTKLNAAINRVAAQSNYSVLGKLVKALAELDAIRTTYKSVGAKTKVSKYVFYCWILDVFHRGKILTIPTDPNEWQLWTGNPANELLCNEAGLALGAKGAEIVSILSDYPSHQVNTIGVMLDTYCDSHYLLIRPEETSEEG